MTTLHAFVPPPQRQRLPDPYQPEQQALAAARARLTDGGAGALDWPGAVARATPWVEAVRAHPAPFWAMESLLREYPISRPEGLALMRLAEALLRVPDVETAVALTADQLGRAEFSAQDGSGGLLAGLSATALNLSKRFLPESEEDAGLLRRLGARGVVAATVRAIQLLGRQFVLGRDIDEALAEADHQRRAQPGLRFSYDMLGEGARTEDDARRYLAAYLKAIDTLAARPAPAGTGPEPQDGISIKLSALFSRYEDGQRERVYAELLPRVWTLIERAAAADLNLTIDAEEVDRLELSLELLEALAERVAQHHPRWRGLGLAVQAYQVRALAVVDEVAAIARRHGLRFMVRLVKGAYWDGEVKRAQEMGLEAYPVFTRKPHTDVNYLACARALLAHRDVIYPQFAGHNAGTIAALLGLAAQAGARPGADFELQRLHGMGDGVFREVLKTPDMACRVYAPVGEHRDLLAYLVRRLLENGANSSFVHQLADPGVPVAELLASPLDQAHPATPEAGPAEGLVLPRALYGADRPNAAGADPTCLAHRAPLADAIARTRVPEVPQADAGAVQAAMAALQAGFPAWNARPVAERVALLRRAADLLEQRLPDYCGLLVREAHKTLGDAISEVREAVDFCRYYAQQAEAAAAGAAGGRGVFVCISPWNFPLAIFAGQVVAALVMGNTVAAKPAEQTPGVAQALVDLLHEAGVPADALQLLNGLGETVGAALVADPRTAGVCFTGSTAVAQAIQRSLADREGPALPLIAETGGLNAMVVDSTALPEQVVDAVVQSAFRSAGQRCSALRLLCLHESVADGILTMLSGALQELRLGDPADWATDVGPVIDDEACAGIQAQVQRLHREARCIGQTALPAAAVPRLVAPVAFELGAVSELRQEIFGPVLHVVRWRGAPEALVDEINALGYGLTFGVQTRIDQRAERLAARARIGNVYVNRNMIGAVVGVQPFGGEGLSGTGPKAGGPFYLRRFAAVPALAAAPAAWPEQAGGAPAAGAWTALATQQADWSDLPVAERVAVLRRMSAAAGATALAPLLAAAEAELPLRELPGPTGERNTLALHGRGVFLVLAGPDAAPAPLTAVVMAALLAGNAVALYGAEPAATAALEAAAQTAGLPPGLLQRVGGALDAVLDRPALAGVALALDAPADALRGLKRRLAARTGALVPLVSLAEAVQPAQLYRFAAEQTVTVNTAAAGGNAALLAGGH